ncbi:hypothetical protein APR12_003143 [Nocardia amikacinitolerans]|nr:hypothetical protein [Nocardia amikacinitolerans]
MIDLVKLERTTLESEIRHWRCAAEALADLDMVAAPSAWVALESYLGLRLRDSLRNVALACAALATQTRVALSLATDEDGLAAVRRAVGTLRRRYVQAETVIDFYADAINTRTNPRIGALLRGLDALAVDSMDRVLGQLGIGVPPVLCYLDKGLGASILRANVRLWDASLSPVAAIKITHHNLRQPTSLVHETGHQVAHLIGWVPELGDAMYAKLRPASELMAETWRGWASEVAADVYAFALLGYAPLPALANVVDGPTRAVFRMPFGDPHPFGWIRVQLGVALCRSWFGSGPWDDLGRVWAARHPLEDAPVEAAAVARGTMSHLPELVDVCTRIPMRAFGGRSLSALVDPRRVAPADLHRLAQRSGRSLHSSSYLQRLEAMRILAWTVLRDQSMSPTALAGTSPTDIQDWLRRVGGPQGMAA